MKLTKEKAFAKAIVKIQKKFASRVKKQSLVNPISKQRFDKVYFDGEGFFG